VSQNSVYVERYLRRRERGTVKEILTPEGVPLRFTVAPVSARFGAFAIDIGFILVALVIMLIPSLALMFSIGLGWGAALLMLSWFFLTNFYFIFFEIRRQGSTPGKRSTGIKVIDRHGGVLSAESIFARNLTRQVEFFIPLVLLLSLSALPSDSTGLLIVVGTAWVFILALLPVFNRDRLRAGDLIGGTVVVLSPREMLLPDLISKKPTQARYEFTPEQLDVYGVYELQILEDLLRPDSPTDPEALEVVVTKIMEKIGWEGEEYVTPRQFLSDFYSAQRARLERGLLFGKRRESSREE
jgi:uncharacterized RDD family membrane protein YckC